MCETKNIVHELQKTRVCCFFDPIQTHFIMVRGFSKHTKGFRVESKHYRATHAIHLNLNYLLPVCNEL